MGVHKRFLRDQSQSPALDEVDKLKNFQSSRASVSSKLYLADLAPLDFFPPIFTYVPLFCVESVFLTVTLINDDQRAEKKNYQRSLKQIGTNYRTFHKMRHELIGICFIGLAWMTK